MKRFACSLLLLFALAGLVQQAGAETRSVSYSTWTLSGNLVILKYLLPAAEAQRLVGADMPLVTIKKLRDYLLAHTAVQSSSGKCAAIDQGWDLGRVDPVAVGPGLLGFEIFFRCEKLAGVVLENRAMFDKVPQHVDFARIETGRAGVNQLFTIHRETLRLPDGAAAAKAGLGQYLSLGVLHILRSPDRLCFLLGVLLLASRRRDIGRIVLGLAAGSLLSIAAAAGGWMVPRMALLDASIGFLVALLAAEMVARELDRSKVAAGGSLLLLVLAAAALLFGSAAWPALVLCGAALLAGGFLAASGKFAAWPARSLPLLALIFGFLDGFVLPNELAPLKLSGRTLAGMAFGFDLGAVLIEAALIGLLLLAGTLAVLKRRKLLLPRPLVTDVVAAGIGGLGAFWFLSRLYI
ncbi:MAG TPA: HupE/UreJ family protein [Gammaproteobacteria bacterium]|nr:HupE/UreJ family protein [Gammaproteobacteria bacterium]